MTDFLAFAAAVIGLLAVPGPTNTLLATAGAAVGARSAFRLLPAEIGGYLVAIGFLTQAVAPLLAGIPAAPLVAKAIASLWLAWLAMRLWRGAGDFDRGNGSPICFRDVFLTTLLNPKAFIFAFGIFPAADARGLLPYAALFSVLVVACGGAWVLLGGAIGRSSRRWLARENVSRGSAIVLAAFSLLFAGSLILPLVA